MDQELEILFKEYDTLLNEIITRTNNGYQLFAVSGGLAAGLIGWFSQHRFDRTFWLLLLVFSFVILVSAGLLIADLRRASLRLQELESQINELAGMELLKWERSWGRGSPGGLIFRRRSR